jgi:amino acid adenylation domain-containing protein
MSFAQERFWFLEQLGSSGDAYNIVLSAQLRGRLAVDALEKAFAALIQRHDVLRTRLFVADGTCLQEIAGDCASFRLHVTEATSDEAAREICEEQARRRFDLRQSGLFRVTLIKLRDDEHVLSIVAHHALLDGWSVGILIRELQDFYRCFVTGCEPDVAPLDWQYADYAAWHRQQFALPAASARMRYWRKNLEGITPTNLPRDRPRSAADSLTAARLRFEVPTEVYRSLKALGARHGATLYMVLLAAQLATMSRWTGQQDIAVGTPTAGRLHRKARDLLGVFVNTLVIRNRWSGDPTFVELLQKVRDTTLMAYANQDVPFERLVAELRPERDTSRQSLFQILFGFDNFRTEPLGLHGLQAERLDHQHANAIVDIYWLLIEGDGELQGVVEYAADLFDASTIERIVASYQRVLAALVSQAEQKIANLPVLDEVERSRLLSWNATGRSYPEDCCVHELFEAQVRRAPEAIAAVYEGESLSYAQLNERADELAVQLRAIGVDADQVVGVYLARSLELVVSTLAVLKAGGAYTLLDPTLPQARLRHALQASQARCVISRSELQPQQVLGEMQYVCLDAPRQMPREPLSRPSRAMGAENLACVMFTSGSTGEPKGIASSHRALVGTYCSQEYAQFDPSQVILQCSPVSWDGFALELWGALLFGGCCVLQPGQKPEPLQLVKLIEQHAVTMLQTSASLFNHLVDHCAEVFGRLQWVATGGEPASAVHVRRALQQFPQLRVINGYGPAESLGFTTTHELQVAALSGASVSIGRPIANKQVYVLDERYEPVPVGVVGEIYAAGVGLARGYTGEAGRTAQRFVPNPFGAVPGERMYRTGDLGRWCADGTLEYLGRNDHQVKIRGYRVELGEIEAQLLRHAQVKQAAVIAREISGEKRLVGYVVPVSVGQGASVDELRRHLQQTLPEYMVPGAFVSLPQLPLTPNGKLDRKALPAPEHDAYSSREYQAPRGNTEQTLARIWSDVLKIERVGRDDDFFRLGGHSLLAMRVMSRLPSLLGKQISLADLYARPILQDLAECLESAPLSGLPPIGRAQRDQRLPLSYAQQRLWFLAQMGAHHAYHNSMGLELRGPLDREALRHSLERIMARHEALRTTFRVIDGQPAQRVIPAAEVRFELFEHDLRTDVHADAELRRIVEEERTTAFDLAEDPPIRGRLIRLADENHALLLTMHHIVSDEWSMGVMMDEIAALYASHLRGEGDVLPELSVQYPDYAVWQRGWLATDVVERQARYWQQTLAGAPTLLQLPSDHARPERQSYRGASSRFLLDEGLTTELRDLSAANRMPLYMTLLAGWAVLLARLSGQDDVVIGMPVANRSRIEIEGLIGFFANTLALRIDLRDAPTVNELLSRTKSQALEAQRNQDLPFQRVVELIRPPRSLAHSPLFQVMFAWKSAVQKSFALPGLDTRPLDVGAHAVSRFDLTLVIGESGHQIAGGIEYATDLFEPATVERYARYFDQLLRSLVADPQRTVDRLEVIAARAPRVAAAR